MARTKKITQNINKDVALMDLPKVVVPHSQWETKWSNYLTCNIGDIVPIYCDEVLDSEKRKITSGMLSHMTTPMAPIFNAQYTEIRTFFVPYRLCADLLGGYKFRKSPFVKVFGQDNASINANIIVPLDDQKLPQINANLCNDIVSHLEPFGGLMDALDYEVGSGTNSAFYTKCNFLDLAAYELIYQKAYRNENRESPTSSNLYRWLFDIYDRVYVGGINYDDKFHIAQREKDYFTGSQPFTLKANAPIEVGLAGTASVGIQGNPVITGGDSIALTGITGGDSRFAEVNAAYSNNSYGKLVADLSSASGVSIENLRLLIKTQELLEKDMMYGSDFASQLNAHFGTAPISLVLEEPLELKKVTITSEMQAIFQTSTTASEPTILGTIGANATTRSGEFEILPLTEFKEPGILMICAVHKAQNSYDATMYKPKRIFKNKRFDFFTPELNDLGFQKVSRLEFCPTTLADFDNAVSYNEAWAEYRFKFNRVHGMLEPSRANAYDFWTLAVSNVTDVQSLYKQDTAELDRALSFKSTTAPQFYDAYGFIEYNDKPMSLHSIPGMDGVI